MLALRKQLREWAALLALAAVLAGAILLDSKDRADAIQEQQAADNDGTPDAAPVFASH